MMTHQAPGKLFHINEGHHDNDIGVIQEIYLYDGYKFRELPTPEYVVDVGAHIGAFSSLVRYDCPDAKIAAYEANPDLMECLQKNVGGFAKVYHSAVTYESSIKFLNAVLPGGQGYTGGSIVLNGESDDDVNPNQYFVDSRPIPTKTLEQIMEENQFPRIDILKLDCEGSEFSILWNTTSLDKVGIIVGEWHNCPGKPWQDMFKLVASRFKGWGFRILNQGTTSGTFWLLRR